MGKKKTEEEGEKRQGKKMATRKNELYLQRGVWAMDTKNTGLKQGDTVGVLEEPFLLIQEVVDINSAGENS